ncbi:MAG: hypothetical protein IKQ06_04020 [Bacilli bacterium]|nr:hypothetical protein [Bacilli bacterium]
MADDFIKHDVVEMRRIADTIQGLKRDFVRLYEEDFFRDLIQSYFTQKDEGDQKTAWYGAAAMKFRADAEEEKKNYEEAADNIQKLIDSLNRQADEWEKYEQTNS